MKKYFPLLFLLMVSNAWANPFVSAGTFVPYFGRMQVSDSGSTQFFDINPQVSVGYLMQIAQSIYFVPEFGYVHYTDNPKKARRSIMLLHYDFATPVTNSTLLRYGLSTYWYKIEGQGGKVKLKNGDGYTNFNAPDKTVTTYYTTVDGGIEHFVNNKISVRFDLHLMGIKNLENKAFNYLLTANYYW